MSDTLRAELRECADELSGAIRRFREDWIAEGREVPPEAARTYHGEYVLAGWYSSLGQVLAALAAMGPCPTCSGPIRETVGMVCQTCGTDYGAKP